MHVCHAMGTPWDPRGLITHLFLLHQLQRSQVVAVNLQACILDKMFLMIISSHQPVILIRRRTPPPQQLYLFKVNWDGKTCFVCAPLYIHPVGQLYASVDHHATLLHNHQTSGALARSGQMYS